MTSFATLQRNRRKLIEDLVIFSCGLDDQIIEKIIVYAECLAVDDERVISEPTFMSQMAIHFNLTSQYMITLISNVLKPVRLPQSKMAIEAFCKLLCIFLTKDLDVKINFVFAVYDLDRDNALSKHEIYAMLKPTLPQGEEEHDEMLKDLIELVMKAVDIDGNGSIDLEEFRYLEEVP